MTWLTFAGMYAVCRCFEVLASRFLINFARELGKNRKVDEHPRT